MSAPHYYQPVDDIARNGAAGVPPIDPSTLSPRMDFRDTAATLLDGGGSPADFDEEVRTWNGTGSPAIVNATGGDGTSLVRTASGLYSPEGTQYLTASAVFGATGAFTFFSLFQTREGSDIYWLSRTISPYNGIARVSTSLNVSNTSGTLIGSEANFADDTPTLLLITRDGADAMTARWTGGNSESLGTLSGALFASHIHRSNTTCSGPNSYVRTLQGWHSLLTEEQIAGVVAWYEANYSVGLT